MISLFSIHIKSWCLQSTSACEMKSTLPLFMILLWLCLQRLFLLNDADLLRLGHDLVLWHDLILNVRGHSCLMHHTLLLICEGSLSHFLDLTRWWLVSLWVLWEVRTFLHEWCLSYSVRGEYFSEVWSLSKNWGIFTSWWDIATSLIGSGHQSVTDSGAITLREKKLVVWRWSLQSFKV